MSAQQLRAAQQMSSKTRVPKPSKNPIHQQRLENLKILIKERFKGKAAHCARAIERSHTFLWQLLNAYRAIGEDSARMIEQKLGLGAGTLDKASGTAFTRNLVLVAQLGDGTAQQIVMAPVIAARDTLGVDRARRTIMGKADRHVPCLGCTEDAYAITVDFVSMEPRLRRGDRAIIEPGSRTVEDGKVYWIKVKATKQPLMRVAVKKDTGRFIFTVPPENRKADDQILAPDEVTVLGRVKCVVRDV